MLPRARNNIFLAYFLNPRKKKIENIYRSEKGSNKFGTSLDERRRIQNLSLWISSYSRTNVYLIFYCFNKIYRTFLSLQLNIDSYAEKITGLLWVIYVYLTLFIPPDARILLLFHFREMTFILTPRTRYLTF